MKRGRAYHRWQRLRTIRRKVAQLKRIGGESYVYAWTQGKPGRLSKGKIHCSCPMCRRTAYDGLSHRDAKRKEAFDKEVLNAVHYLSF